MIQRVHLRGEVYWVDFTTAHGGEIGKVRPAVMVSNDLSNRYANRVQVVPFTSSTGRVYPSEALVQFRDTPHKAMADQIATVIKERLGDRIGVLTPQDMLKAGQAILRQLGLTRPV